MKQGVFQGVVSISPAQLKDRLQRTLPTDLLDVRTPPEYASLHLPEAKLVPLDDLDPTIVLQNRSDPNEPLFILCQSGARAARAIEKFNRAGFGNCVLVEGGMEACVAAGLPVVRGSSRVIPLMRQVQVVVGAAVLAGAALALLVDVRFCIIPMLAGGGLLFAGVTGKCGLAILLAKMPWNRRCEKSGPSCCGA